MILNAALPAGPWGVAGTTSYNGSEFDRRMRDFHDALPSVIRRQVQPVQTTFPDAFANQPTGWWNRDTLPVPVGAPSNPTALWVGGENTWLVDMNHSSVPAAMREDLTAYTPGGERKAFPTRESRIASNNLLWTLRTRSAPNTVWILHSSEPLLFYHGGLIAPLGNITNNYNIGPRPALVLHDQDGAWTSGL